MSFSNYLSEKRSTLVDVEYMVESTNVEMLEEAIEKFADLPNAWKKILSKSSLKAGENSEVETHKYPAKNEASFNKSISDAFKKSTENSFIIIEVEDQPFALLYNSNSDHDPEKFSFTTTDGNSITSRKFIDGNRRNNYKGYYAPQRYFKTNEAKDKLKFEVLEFAKTVIENGSELRWDDLFKLLTINVVLVKGDAVRAEISSKRKDARDYVDNISTAKKKVIRNFMVDVVDNIVEDIKRSTIQLKDADELLDDILEGKELDYDAIKDLSSTINAKVSDLERILKAFKSAYNSGKIMNHNYWEEKAGAGMDLKYLLKAIKRYEETFKSE